ncbi:MAG: undecaprenyl-diphosphate phosphatase [Conexibacter sp.]|nr:undecaprenyl-diphosphate phosphatase [Conexibacter sp.]
MPPEGGRLPLVHAVALGALHGPAELVPVSSSAHVALIPQLLDWPSARLDDDVRKAFEVALHAGTLGGLLLLVPRPSLRWAVVATAPAAVIGFTLEKPIERRLGGVRATAAGLVVGSLVLVAADRAADGDGPSRPAQDATLADAAVLGLAQACALWPGISRLGLTIAAARLRGFDREAAFDLGRRAGLPVIAGATGLKAWRLARNPPPPDVRFAFAAGMAAALGATLASAPLRRMTSVAAPAAERIALAALAARRLRRSAP